MTPTPPPDQNPHPRQQLPPGATPQHTPMPGPADSLNRFTDTIRRATDNGHMPQPLAAAALTGAYWAAAADPRLNEHDQRAAFDAATKLREWFNDLRWQADIEEAKRRTDKAFS